LDLYFVSEEFSKYWVGKKFFAFFSKILWNNRESSRKFHIKSINR
jgi:hypothetical protein